MDSMKITGARNSFNTPPPPAISQTTPSTPRPSYSVITNFSDDITRDLEFPDLFITPNAMPPMKKLRPRFTPSTTLLLDKKEVTKNYNKESDKYKSCKLGTRYFDRSLLNKRSDAFDKVGQNAEESDRSLNGTYSSDVTADCRTIQKDFLSLP